MDALSLSRSVAPAPTPGLRRSHRRKLEVSASFIRSVRSKIGLSLSKWNPNVCTASPSPTSQGPAKSGIRIKQISSHSLAPSIRHQVGIRRLPHELLAQIITIGSWEDAMLPISSSQVCRSWRRFLLHTPSIWTTILLDTRVSMWHERIRRARGCLLDVYLHEPAYKSPWPKWDHHLVQWILQPALPHLHRWRTFDVRLSTPSPFLWNAVLSPLCGDSRHVGAPTLESLVLSYPANDDGKQFALFGGYVPHLHQITVDSIRLACPSIFRNVRSLSYTHRCTPTLPSVTDVMTILQACSSIQHLSLRFDVYADATPLYPLSEDEPPVAYLPHLRHLELEILGEDIPPDTTQVLQYMRIPVLESLRLAHKAPTRSLPLSHWEHCVGEFETLGLLRTLKVENGWANPRLVLIVAARAPRLAEVDVVVHGHSAVRILVPDQMLNRDDSWLKRCRIPWLVRPRRR